MNSAPLPPAIPDYELVRELGRGSFGSVWLARSRTGVHHALKIVPKTRSSALEKEFEGLCAFEVQAGRHPSLIEVRHVGETDSALYCVMELADGYGTAQTFSADDYEPRTLQSELERKGALDLTELAPIVRDVLDGLQHLHARGLLHRDVKPANIVFVDGRAKLADIGLVASRARREDHAGSPGFMPPETVIDPSGDLYSLGLTLFCAVTGASVGRFPELPETIAPERLAAYRKIAPVLDRACAPDPEERFHDAREFRHAYDVATGAVVGPAARTRRRVIAAIVVTALAAAGFGLWRATRSDFVAARASVELAGRIEIHYRDPSDLTRILTVSEATPYVPLLTHGAVSVHAELAQPAFPVLAYLDGNGAARILYPGPEDDAHAMRARVATDTFELEEPTGTLTFVLLASHEPVTDLEQLERLVAQAGDPPHCPPNALLHVGEDGRARSIAARVEPTRGPAPDLGRKIGDGPLTAPTHGSLDRLREVFGARFDLVRALAVPQVSLQKK